MFCTKCGFKASNNTDRFCSRCGHEHEIDLSGVRNFAEPVKYRNNKAQENGVAEVSAAKRVSQIFAAYICVYIAYSLVAGPLLQSVMIRNIFFAAIGAYLGWLHLLKPVRSNLSISNHIVADLVYIPLATCAAIITNMPTFDGYGSIFNLLFCVLSGVIVYWACAALLSRQRLH